MACVLSTTALYQSQYNGNITDIQNIALNYLDLNWINTRCQHSCFQDDSINCAKCQIGSKELCRMTIENGISGSVTNGSFDLNKDVSDEQDLVNGVTGCSRKSDRCFISDISKYGEKRKTLTDICDEVYISSKRVSPYLNTPQERKDEHRKLLKLSMKKIKELGDPETFLRRSVLVNNLTKCLQTQFRGGKYMSKKLGSYRGKYFNDYKVLNNNILSDINLCEDPFLSSTCEAITDDMTYTLINNALIDNKLNETEEGIYS